MHTKDGGKGLIDRLLHRTEENWPSGILGGTKETSALLLLRAFALPDRCGRAAKFQSAVSMTRWIVWRARFLCSPTLGIQPATAWSVFSILRVRRQRP